METNIEIVHRCVFLNNFYAIVGFDVD
jgi:hypothetical protein